MDDRMPAYNSRLASCMRSESDKCLLCKEDLSTQRNSHTIPKFFGQGLFYGTLPKHSLLLTKEGKMQKVQDTLKEDYLFCPTCEKGFNTLETYCSLRLERYNDLRFSSQFQHYKFGDFEYFDCIEINIKVFNLFIYSIVWRVSISDNYGFLGFKLPVSEEEKLRLVLKETSSKSQEDLFGKIDQMTSLPEHSHVIIRPSKKLRPPSSMLSAASYNDIIHQVHLVDYVLFYLTTRTILTQRFELIDNNRVDGFVHIGLTKIDDWKKFNKTMINEATKL